MSRAYGPQVTSMTLLASAAANDEGPFHLQVDGRDFLERAAPLAVKLGEQFASGVTLRNEGRGFIGVLRRAPRDGDRLFVGYADGPLEPTNLVFFERLNSTR